MKNKFSEKIEIPKDIICTYENNILTCKKDSAELSRDISIPKVKIKMKDNSITFNCDKANKKEIKAIKSFMAHIKNIFQGLDEPYTYNLEACNVHFPMNLKVESNQVIITNFLGETIQRKSKILPNVTVEIKGQKITVSSHDKEAAGQTAASLEYATKVKGRDRRIFQDGIFITDKPEKKK